MWAALPAVAAEMAGWCCRADAQNGIDMLNGHGYDHLILKVEWYVGAP